MVLGGNSVSKVFGIQVRGPKFRSPAPTCKAGHDSTHLWVMEIGSGLLAGRSRSGPVELDLGRDPVTSSKVESNWGRHHMYRLLYTHEIICSGFIYMFCIIYFPDGILPFCPG